MKIYFADNGNLIRKTLISQIVRYMVLMAPLVILGLWDWLLNKPEHKSRQKTSRQNGAAIT